MNEERLVLNVGWFSFKDEKTGNTIEGVKITSTSLDKDLNENANGVVMYEDKFRGLDILSDLETVPGIYQMQYGIVPKRGKVELELKGLNLVKEVDLSNIISTKKEDGKFPAAVGK